MFINSVSSSTLCQNTWWQNSLQIFKVATQTTTNQFSKDWVANCWAWLRLMIWLWRNRTLKACSRRIDLEIKSNIFSLIMWLTTSTVQYQIETLHAHSPLYSSDDLEVVKSLPVTTILCNTIWLNGRHTRRKKKSYYWPL